MNEPYQNKLGRKLQVIRLLWSLSWFLLASWIPRSLFSDWKRFLLRLFGAKITKTAIVYSSAKIYYPANLFMDDYTCIDMNVDLYNIAPVYIGKFATVSQGAFLYTATQDIEYESHELITKPINI